MGHICKLLLLHDLGSSGNQYVNFYPLNIEHAKLPSRSGGEAAASADARGCLFQSEIRNPQKSKIEVSGWLALLS
jgi:hypothetical protein